MSKSRRPLRAIFHHRTQFSWNKLGDHPVFITFLIALLVAGGMIHMLETRLRPVLERVASAQTQNEITAVIEQAVTQNLIQNKIHYGDLVCIQQDGSGNITAITTNMAQINLIRVELTGVILNALEEIDISTIFVPLGSLLGFDLLWARGPVLRAQAMTVGTVTTEFESELVSAGVNQTLHKIWLDIQVPLTVLLPGGEIHVPVHTRLSVAETVIVGQVPSTYLNLNKSLSQ